jgi:hypothetical protein
VCATVLPQSGVRAASTSTSRHRSPHPPLLSRNSVMAGGARSVAAWLCCVVALSSSRQVVASTGARYHGYGVRTPDAPPRVSCAGDGILGRRVVMPGRPQNTPNLRRRVAQLRKSICAQGTVGRARLMRVVWRLQAGRTGAWGRGGGRVHPAEPQSCVQDWTVFERPSRDSGRAGGWGGSRKHSSDPVRAMPAC